MAKKRYTVRLANGRTLTTSNPAAWASRTGVTVEGWGGSGARTTTRSGSGQTSTGRKTTRGQGHPGGTDKERAAPARTTTRGGGHPGGTDKEQKTKPKPKPQPTRTQPQVDVASLIAAVKEAIAPPPNPAQQAAMYGGTTSSPRTKPNPAQQAAMEGGVAGEPLPIEVRMAELIAQRDHDNDLEGSQRFQLAIDEEMQRKAHEQIKGAAMNPAQAAAMYGGTPGLTPSEKMQAEYRYKPPGLAGVDDETLGLIALQEFITPFAQTEAAATGTAPGTGTGDPVTEKEPEKEKEKEPPDKEKDKPDEEVIPDDEDEDIIQQIAQILFGGGGGGGGMPEVSGGPGLPGRLGNPLEQFTNADLIAPEVLRILRGQLPQGLQQYAGDMAWLSQLGAQPAWSEAQGRYV